MRNSKGDTLEPEVQYTLGDLITRAREVPRAVALMGALSDAHSRLLSHVYGTGNGEGRAAVNHTMAVTRSAIRANYHTHIAYYLQERCTFQGDGGNGSYRCDSCKRHYNGLVGIAPRAYLNTPLQALARRMQARLAAHYAACAMNDTDPNMPQGLRGKTVRMVSGMVHGAMAPTARKMLRDGEATVWLGQIQAGVDDLLQLDAERVPLVQVCWWQYEEWKANQLTGTTTVTHRSWMRASRAVAGLVNTQHLLSSLAQPAEPRPAMDNDNLGRADTPSPLLTNR